MRGGSPEFTFEHTLLSRTEGKGHGSHFLGNTLGRSAHPSILGPGFREPNPERGFGPPRGRQSLSRERVVVWTIRSMSHRGVHAVPMIEARQIDRACLCPGSADVPVRHIDGSPRLPLRMHYCFGQPFRKLYKASGLNDSWAFIASYLANALLHSPLGCPTVEARSDQGDNRQLAADLVRRLAGRGWMREKEKA